MKRLGKILLFLFALAVLTLVALFWALSPPRSGEVSQEIQLHLRSGFTQITISQLTVFAWTELKLFGPYGDRAMICSQLNLKEPECDRIAPESIDEGQFLLAFKDGDRLVHTEFHDRSNGDFRNTNVLGSVPSSASTFNVVQEPQPDGRIWYRLVLLEQPGG
jgi:hypothetical protein